MERADWLEAGFDPAQARFLMITAITHHRFDSPAWGEHEIRKLHAELTEIDGCAAQEADPADHSAGVYDLGRRHPARWGQEGREAA
jgi:hypothetical protein